MFNNVTDNTLIKLLGGIGLIIFLLIISMIAFLLFKKHKEKIEEQQKKEEQEGLGKVNNQKYHIVQNPL